MKLILAILSDQDTEPVSQALTGSEFRVTRIASTGGLFRRGSTTLLVGVEDEKVDQAIGILRQSLATPVEAGAKRATLFVVNVENFTQL